MINRSLKAREGLVSEALPLYGGAMREDRLLRLAGHLENRKLWHDRFDFTTVSTPYFIYGKPCDTAGCAIGECRLLWGEAWASGEIQADFFDVSWPEWYW